MNQLFELSKVLEEVRVEKQMRAGFFKGLYGTCPALNLTARAIIDLATERDSLIFNGIHGAYQSGDAVKVIERIDELTNAINEMIKET